MTEGVEAALIMEKEFQELCNVKSVSHIDGYSDFVFVNRFGEVLNAGALNAYSVPLVRPNRRAWCTATAEMVHPFRADGAWVSGQNAQLDRLN